MVKVHVGTLFVHFFDVLDPLLSLHLLYLVETLYSSLPAEEDVQRFNVHPLNPCLTRNLVDEVEKTVHLFSLRPVALLHCGNLAV